MKNLRHLIWSALLAALMFGFGPSAHGQVDGCGDCQLRIPAITVTDLGHCQYGFSVSGVSTRCPIINRIWNYGDASATTSGSVGLHTYSSPGTYTVCVTYVVNAVAGPCSLTTCTTIVVPNCDPDCGQCVITPGTMTVLQPTPCLARVIMGGSVSACPLVGFSYNFGDGTTISSSSPFAQHNYSTSGSYTICVTETRALGTDTCTYTYCQTIQVVGCNDGCEACPITPGTMSVQKLSACWYGVFVSGSSSPCAIDHWEVNFGDGTGTSTSSSSFFSHTYTSSGTYTICITEVRTNGTVTCRQVYCRTITVTGCPTMKMAGDADYTWKIYPSVLTAGARLTYEMPADLGNVELILMDATGRAVQTYTAESGKGSFRLPEGIAPGMYFLKADKAELATLRLIVQ